MACLSSRGRLPLKRPSVPTAVGRLLCLAHFYSRQVTALVTMAFGPLLTILASLWTDPSVARSCVPQKDSSACCDLFRLGSGASVSTTVGPGAHRSFPRTKDILSQYAVLVLNGCMLQNHTFPTSPFSSPSLEHEDHDDAVSVGESRAGQAAAEPSHFPLTDDEESSVGARSVFRPETRGAPRNLLGSLSSAIRIRLFTSKSPCGSMALLVLTLTRTLVQHPPATIERDLMIRSAIRSTNHMKDLRRPRPRIATAGTPSCCFVSHLFGCFAAIPFGLLFFYSSSVYPGGSHFGSHKGRGRGMRHRGGPSAADPLVPRTRTDYTKGMRDNFKGEELQLLEASPMIPPGWDSDDRSPEAPTFRDYCQRLSRWLMITNLPQDQQVIRIHNRLRGLAWLLVNQFNDRQVTQGDSVHGQHYGPVTFMIIVLAMHFAPNVDEARARALRRWSMFKRGFNENTETMYFRYKCERIKVAEEAGLQIPWDLQAEKIIQMCPMPRSELLKLLEPLNYRVPATQAELDSFVQTLVQWEKMNSRSIPGNLYDNITRIYNGESQHNMMRSYFQESHGLEETQVFTTMEEIQGTEFHGHLPVLNQEGEIVDWKEQVEGMSTEWMSSFPVGVNSENDFLSALIGQDELFRDPQPDPRHTAYDARYDATSSWPGPSSSHSEQAWYGHDAAAPSYGSGHWGSPSPAHQPHHSSPYSVPPPAPMTYAQPPGGYHQHAYMSRPYASHEDMEPSSDGTDSDTSSDAGEHNAKLERISAYIANAVGPDPQAVEQAIFQAYRNSKKLWRRHKNKFVRKFRRFVKRGVRKRKGYGKGRSYRSFPAIEQEMLAYMSSKGKGKRSSSGKGFGRKGNPMGKSGKPMLCHECNSPDHLVRDCPVRKAKMSGKGGGGFSGALLTDGYDHEADNSADFAPWEDVDPDLPGQPFEAEVTFSSGHPT